MRTRTFATQKDRGRPLPLFRRHSHVWDQSLVFFCVSFAGISTSRHGARNNLESNTLHRNKAVRAIPVWLFPGNPGRVLAGLSCLPGRANGQAKGVGSTYWVAAPAIPASEAGRPPLDRRGGTGNLGVLAVRGPPGRATCLRGPNEETRTWW